MVIIAFVSVKRIFKSWRQFNYDYIFFAILAFVNKPRIYRLITTAKRIFQQVISVFAKFTNFFRDFFFYVFFLFHYSPFSILYWILYPQSSAQRKQKLSKKYLILSRISLASLKLIKPKRTKSLPSALTEKYGDWIHSPKSEILAQVQRERKFFTRKLNIFYFPLFSNSLRISFCKSRICLLFLSISLS